MSDLEKALQQLLDHCAQEVDRVTDWKERTDSDRDSHVYGMKEGTENRAVHFAHYVLGIAERHGLALDLGKLLAAEDRRLWK